MLNFAYRNLLLFFRDRTAVILSFLSEFIIVGLYFLFIRDNLLTHFPQLPDAELLMDVWMMSGLLGITSFSASIGAYGILVDDKVKKIYKDFYITPRSNITFLGGYYIGAIAIGSILTFLLFLILEIYIFLQYDVLPGSDVIWSVYGILLLASISNSSITLLLTSFIKSSNALAACCTILGALIGFLTGIYLPIGNLPEAVQVLVTHFPVSHGVILFRQLLMQPFLANVFGGLNTNSATEFIQYMGICFSFDGELLSRKNSVMILIITTLFCFTFCYIKNLKHSDF